MPPVLGWEKVVVGVAAVLVLGCGRSSNAPNGDAGSQADGQAAADAGTDTTREASADAGTSNDAGGLPACMGMTPAAVAGLCVLDPTGARAISPTPFAQVPVTVVSVGSGLPASACAGGGPNGLDPNTNVTRIVLRTVAGAEWIVYVLGVGAGVVSSGDALEMSLTTGTVVGWITQMLTLTRGTEGELAFFSAAMNDVPGGPLMPQQPGGVSLQILELICRDDIAVPCARRRRRMQINVGDDAMGFIEPGQVVQVGSLRLSLAMLDQVVDNGNCDQPTTTLITGYMTP